MLTLRRSYKMILGLHPCIEAVEKITNTLHIYADCTSTSQNPHSDSSILQLGTTLIYHATLVDYQKTRLLILHI